MAILATRRRWLVTSLCAASRSPCSRQRLASRYSSCRSSIGNRWISTRYGVRLDSVAARQTIDLDGTDRNRIDPISSSNSFETKLSMPIPPICQCDFERLLVGIMSARATAALLLQTGRIVQAGGYDGELSPAQWMALRFFARANRFSRTPSAFAEFQATTRGTATQTIKALEAGGYLVRQRLESDGRSVTLRLTDKGNEAVACDPFEVLVRAVDSLDAKAQTA